MLRGGGCFRTTNERTRDDARGISPEPAPRADELVAVTERQRAVHRAIERLSSEHREIVELRHFQDLSYDEIGAVLELPNGTVMSRLYRARQALRATLADEPGFGGIT